MRCYVMHKKELVGLLSKQCTNIFTVCKDAQIINKCVYSVLGINRDGRKEILGIWISENESTSFWLIICNELKSSGVQNIPIACRDNSSGFSDVVATVFPKIEQRKCPFDNAIAEATFKFIKTEFIRIYHFESLNELSGQKLASYVNWFNSKRIHSTLGCLSPLEYKLAHLKKTV
jgi:hypothetical protein